MSSDFLLAEDPRRSERPKLDPRLGRLLYPDDSRRGGSKPAPEPLLLRLLSRLAIEE